MTETTKSWAIPAALAITLVVLAGFMLWVPQLLSPVDTDDPNANSSQNNNPYGLVTDRIVKADVYEANLAAAETARLADTTTANRRLISVSGSNYQTVTPDEVVINLAIETLNANATPSQQQNATITDRVLTALANAGVTTDQIKTTGYSLSEEYEWNETLRKSESIGYRTRNTVTVTLTDLTKTGTVIDAAVTAGANRVNGITFGLTDESEENLRVEALALAAQNARTKAQSIALGLNVTLGTVFSASENASISMPYYYGTRSYDMAAEGAAVAPTAIVPGDVEFSTTVSVQFEIA